MSRHETHEWKTSDAKAPVFTCTRCWIDGGDPMAGRPCPGVRMRPFNKSALAQIEAKTRDDQLPGRRAKAADGLTHGGKTE
jgi:hypothetical protein